MKLPILFFSVLRDIVGASEIELDLPLEDADVSDLLAALYERWPALRDWDGRIRVAVNLEYVSTDYPLAEGQEIAVMPPVQGG